MSNFIDIDFTVDTQTLLDMVITHLVDNGWVPDSSDPEVVYAEAFVAVAAYLADAIGQVPSAIFRKFGTDLVGVPYQPGVTATAFVTVTASETVTGTDLTIPAGTQFELGNGFYFANVADIVIPVGSTSATTQELRALLEGSDANGITGAAQPVSTMANIASVTIEGTTGGGADAEDDSTYQDRLTGELELLAPRPITADDFATFSRNVPDIQVGRSTAIDGYIPAVALTGNFTSGSAIVTNTDTSKLVVGVAVSGTGIPASTTVKSIESSSQFTMTANATSSATGRAFTFGGTSGNERACTVFDTAVDGTALDAGDKAAILAYLAAHRELNFLVYVEDASYNAINVTYSVVAYPGFDHAALVASVNDAISAFLSPLTWGSSGRTQTGDSPSAVTEWLNQTVVRYNKLIGVIEAVNGVDYVASMTINGSATDHTMTGPAPLPTTGTLTGSAT